jgi:hypothetical protein
MTIKIVLPAGEAITVEIENTDTAFTLSYGVDGVPTLLVTATEPDDSGREGTIYEETFEFDDEADGETEESDEEEDDTDEDDDIGW